MGCGPIPRGALAALAVLFAAGCNVLLGYDEGQLGGGPTTSSGTLGGGGTGGASSTGTGTAGAGGASTGIGGTGGEAGAATTSCTLWPEGSDGCGPGDKCSVVNETTGRTECVPAGSHPPWARCLADSDCRDRTWCDHGSGVCKPVCESEANCPTGASCIAATMAGGGPIVGLQICTAYCDPRNPLSCNQSNGTTNCLYGSNGFDCFWSGNGLFPDTCSDFLECGPPQTCFGGSCRAWCDSVGHNCPPLHANCYPYTSPIFYSGTEVGYCSNL